MQPSTHQPFDNTTNHHARNPRVSDLINPRHCLSLGFGSGLIKPAPGTWGTIAALPLWLLFATSSPTVYVLLLAISFALGVYLCGYTAKQLGTHDHSAIVWDEFVGVWFALFLVPSTWIGVLCAFALFRLFDIWKPWPIRYLDQHVHGGLGIMLDDVLAGVLACIGTHGFLYCVSNMTA